METIISYIDNLFNNYPDTEQVRKAKRDLLSIMEDKYNELKAEGKSENEAIGIVISEFGNMDEIIAELGIQPAIAADDDMADCRPEKKLSLQQVKDYIKAQKDFGVHIAAGVALCILSPVMACVLDPLAMAGVLDAHFTDTIGGLSLFLIIAVAVGIFIVQGISNSKYDDMKKSKLVLDYSTKQYVTDESEKYNGVFAKRIAIGVMLCILSVVPIIVVDALFANTSYSYLAEMASATLFLLIAAGVGCIITAGITKGAYEILLEKKVYTQKNKKAEKVMSAVAGIYWCIATAIYLLWSFTTGQWEITWIIWPVAGILFGAISIIVNLAMGNDSE